MIFLMYNMGNSGGSWFERVCNSHPDVHAWEELHRQMGYAKQSMEAADVYAVEFLRNQIEKWKSIGLIKSFGKQTVDYCKANDGKIVQMYRHPIKVVDHKMGKKTDACRKVGISTGDVFTDHVRFYRSRYEQFQNNSERYPLFRLETLSDHLVNKPRRFSEIMQFITGVEWTDSQVSKVLSVLPTGKKSFDEDHSEIRIWERWNQHQKDVFVENFESIMRKAGYSLP